MKNGIVKIYPEMQSEPNYVFLVHRTIGRYEVSLKKAKVWFHDKIDYEFEIFDHKTKKILAQGSGHDISESDRNYSGLKQLFNSFECEKDVRAWAKGRLNAEQG